MTYTKKLAQYIYNCLKMYNTELAHYSADAHQEIFYAIYVSKNEKEAIRLSARMCRRMLRDFGWRPPKVRKRYEEYIRSISHSLEL
ncbi:MAG: hypothetical protein LBG15_08205 [Dysgonamonadaceae bacterium]|jgi:hypothetical protein|nr:hypothetical protein [Dysgonamonadaceae bacterium]